MRRERPSELDTTLLGKRVRTFRIRRGLTQLELAIRAGVSLSTVYHVESGRPTRWSSLRKVCVDGLDTAPEDLVKTQEKRGSEPFLLYRAETAAWREEHDRRRTVPPDSLARNGDAGERARLGKLGFVASFMNNPNIVMPEGPGTVFLEIHGRREGNVNAGVYRDAKLYCQTGGVRCAFAERTVELREGDMIGYASADLLWIEPLDPTDAPSLLLWMGAVSVGKANPDNGRRTIVRKPRAPA